MKTILKSFIYSFYFAKVSLKNYLPLIVYLVISQFLIMITQNMTSCTSILHALSIASAPVALKYLEILLLKKILLIVILTL